tara:strand:+ start:527 stop:637 length:111 start_codon:yes stop_codon:yes gene_type:complete
MAAIPKGNKKTIAFLGVKHILLTAIRGDGLMGIKKT